MTLARVVVAAARKKVPYCLRFHLILCFFFAAAHSSAVFRLMQSHYGEATVLLRAYPRTVAVSRVSLADSFS